MLVTEQKQKGFWPPHLVLVQLWCPVVKCTLQQRYQKNKRKFSKEQCHLIAQGTPYRFICLSSLSYAKGFWWYWCWYNSLLSLQLIEKFMWEIQFLFLFFFSLMRVMIDCHRLDIPGEVCSQCFLKDILKFSCSYLAWWLAAITQLSYMQNWKFEFSSLLFLTCNVQHLGECQKATRLV